jgi:hypothetical protein
MVSDETIVFDWALVADETLGFPAEGQDAALDAETRKVIAGLAEEPQPDLQGAALDEFLSDAVKLADSYKEMLSEIRRLSATRDPRLRERLSRNSATLIFAFSDRRTATW